MEETLSESKQIVPDESTERTDDFKVVTERVVKIKEEIPATFAEKQATLDLLKEERERETADRATEDAAIAAARADQSAVRNATIAGLEQELADAGAVGVTETAAVEAAGEDEPTTP